MVWLCRCVYEYVGFLDPVEDNVDHGERDDFESGEGEVVSELGGLGALFLGGEVWYLALRQMCRIV